LKYSESTLRYIGDLVNKGRLQDAVEIAKDSGKYSEDEAKSFIIQNESVFRNERTEKRVQQLTQKIFTAITNKTTQDQEL